MGRLSCSLMVLGLSTWVVFPRWPCWTAVYGRRHVWPEASGMTTTSPEILFLLKRFFAFSLTPLSSSHSCWSLHNPRSIAPISTGTVDLFAMVLFPLGKFWGFFNVWFLDIFLSLKMVPSKSYYDFREFTKIISTTSLRQDKSFLHIFYHSYRGDGTKNKQFPKIYICLFIYLRPR